MGAIKQEDTGLRQIFYPGGQALQAGALLTRPDLAKVLTAVANQGAVAFYTGDIAQDIVDTVSTFRHKQTH